MATGYWRGADNANWSTGTNWFDNITGPTTLTDATVPGAGNIAFFNANGTTTARTVYLNAPAGRSIGTFWMNGNAQGDITLRGGVSGGETTQTLTLGGIDMSGTSANSVWASSVSVALANNNSWNIGSGRAILVSGVISGAFKLTSNNSGVIILGNANTYSGGTDISAGTVRAGNNQALGTGAGSTITMTGGKLSSSSTTGYTLANALSLNNTVTLGDATNNGALTFSGTTTIEGNTTLNLEAGNFMTFSGAIAGTGSWTMSRGTSTSIVGVKLTGPSGGTSGAVTANANVVLFLADFNSGTPNQLANAASITANSYNFQIAGNTAHTFTQAISGSTTLYSWNSHVNGITFNNFSGWSGAVEMIGDTTYAATQKITVASAFSFGTLRFSPTNAVALATQTFAYAGANANTSSTALSINSQGVSTGVVAIVENGSSNLLTISGQASHAASSAATASTLRFATTTGNIAYSGNITEASTGTLNLSKTGSNALTLSGSASTYRGTVSVSAGTLNANSATALGAANSTAGISVTSGATLSLGGTSNITYTAPRTLTLAGTGVSPSTPGALVIANAVTNTFSGIELTAGTLVRASESGTLTSPVTTNNHNLTFTVAASKTLTLPSTSVISTSTSTVSYNTVSGDTGTAVVSAQNLYTNPTVIDRGAVRIGASSVGSPGSLTSGPLGRGQLTWNGGALDASTTATLGNNVAVGGNVSFEGTAALTLAGTVSLGASRTVTVNGNYPLYLSGIVSGIGYKITKAGTGKLVLDNAGNTYSGGTDIGAGTVTFASGGLGSSGTIGMLGGALQWAAGNTQDISSRLSITGGVAYFDTGANDVSFATPYTTATGSSVYKLGSGSLTLSYPNNWSGTFVLQAGTVYSGGNGSLGTSAASLNFYAGKVSASSTSFISYSPTGTSLIGGDITFGDAVKTGSQSFACDFSLDSGTRIVTTVAPTTFAGKIYNGNLTKAGSSSLTLSGQSTTYLGLTTLSAGTLGVTNNNALGATAASLALNGGTFASVINDPYTLTMVAAGDSTIGGNVTFGDGLTTGTLTLVNNFALGTSTSRFLTVATGTTQVFTGIISGSGSSIAKNGSGTLRLSGANTYSGGTYIDAGTLQTGNVQALGTSGTVTLSVSGATLQTLTTGGQNGKLTVAALTNSAGGTIKIGG